MKLIAILLPVCVIAAVLPARAEEDGKELQKLQGTWSFVSAHEGGVQETDEKAKKLFVIIKDDIFSFKAEGQPETMTMKVTLDPSSDPKSIDFTSTMGEAPKSAGIYRLEGDELKLCWSRNSKPRPTSFDTKPGDERLFLTLKRAK